MLYAVLHYFKKTLIVLEYLQVKFSNIFNIHRQFKKFYNLIKNKKSRNLW